MIDVRLTISQDEARSELRMFGRENYHVAFVEQVSESEYLLHDDGERGPAWYSTWPAAVSELLRRVSEDVGMLAAALDPASGVVVEVDPDDEE